MHSSVLSLEHTSKALMQLSGNHSNLSPIRCNCAPSTHTMILARQWLLCWRQESEETDLCDKPIISTSNKVVLYGFHLFCE